MPAPVITVHQGDALEVLRGLPSRSAHALVTDPPAGIAFMGAGWDRDRGGREKWVRWLAEILAEARRVLRPGSHALVWALPRTAHWTACALEDAGFEIRDVILHLYGQGFPKSLDVSKAVDRAAGVQREVIGTAADFARDGAARAVDGSHTLPGWSGGYGDRWAQPITAPASAEAQRWSGWGTALKPAAEHWILARVPLEGTVAANVLEHGTGALHIDGCRIACEGESPSEARRQSSRASGRGPGRPGEYAEGRVVDRVTDERFMQARAGEALGRWPANVVLSGDAPALLDEQSGYDMRPGERPARRSGIGYHGGDGGTESGQRIVLDSGGASRFFYCAKASRAERGEGNRHPTVKPLELMRWLVRLVTPPGGTVLDPFAGSGSTGLACLAEGCFAAVLIEQDASFARTALERARRESPLFHAAPLREVAP